MVRTLHKHVHTRQGLVASLGINDLRIALSKRAWVFVQKKGQV